ncbi:MAG: hypothetical protein JJ845_001785 [Prochlorococcus marinus CUG1436]|nr:hypothetical protein [Prochlorococcus marinus CUG1436]
MNRRLIHFLIFFTEGDQLDNGDDLRNAMQIYTREIKKYFESVLIYTPSILIEKNSRWINIFENQVPLIEKQIFESKNKILWNKSWAKINHQLWKPELIFEELSHNKKIKEGDIVFYHDVNVKKYPIYLKQLKFLKQYINRNMQKKSVLLFRDNLTKTSEDTRTEIIYKYLGCDGKNLFHVWSGCLAIKNDFHGVSFTKIWLDMTREKDNRSQFTTKKQPKEFYWHSVDQSTLTLSYYLAICLYKFKNKITLKFLKNQRMLPPLNFSSNLVSTIKFMRDFLKIRISMIIFLGYKRRIIELNKIRTQKNKIK